MKNSLKTQIRKLEDDVRERERAEPAPEEGCYDYRMPTGAPYYTPRVRKTLGFTTPISEALDAYVDDLPGGPGTSEATQSSDGVEQMYPVALEGDLVGRAWRRVFVERYRKKARGAAFSSRSCARASLDSGAVGAARPAFGSYGRSP